MVPEGVGDERQRRSTSSGIRDLHMDIPESMVALVGAGRAMQVVSDPGTDNPFSGWCARKRCVRLQRMKLGPLPVRTWIEYLVSILAGNALYFLVLFPWLPTELRHEPYHPDLGFAFDGLVCVAVYRLLRVFVRS